MTTLQFTLSTEAGGANTSNFRPDPEKKSAFWMDDCCCASPAHVFIAGPQQQSIFFLGGFQLISNAKTVEIYLTKDGDETYLTTCRGVPFEGHSKIVCVIPGGPRPIQQAHLKPSTQDDDEFKLISLRVTARIPEVSASVEPTTTAVPNHPNPVPTSPPPVTPAIPASPNNPTGNRHHDWSTAMAGLAFLVRSTAEQHSQHWHAVEQQQRTLESRILPPLCQQVASQSSLLFQQSEQIQQQTVLIRQQQEQIQALSVQVKELTTIVQQRLVVVDTSVHGIDEELDGANVRSTSDSEKEMHRHDDDDDDDDDSLQSIEKNTTRTTEEQDVIEQ